MNRDAEPWFELAGRWGLEPGSVVQAAAGNQIAAAHWRHGSRTLNDAPIPDNTFVYMLNRARSWRHVGGRSEAASDAPGGMGLLARGSYGGWTFESPIDVLHVQVPQSLLDDLALQCGAGRRVQLHDRLRVEDPVLPAFAREILSAMADGSKPGRLYLETLGQSLAMRLLLNHCDAAPASRAPACGGLASWQVRRVCDYLNADLARDTSLDELAALLGLSRWHFCRAFKHSTGVPPHQWLRRQRMERAQELLRQTTLSVTQVAAAVGYEDPGQFATAFRAAAGRSPSHYRRLAC